MNSATQDKQKPKSRQREVPSVGPAEGWLTVLLHFSLIGLAAYAAALLVDDQSVMAIVWIALLGATIGLLLAKSGVPGWVAHPLALLSGIVVVLVVDRWSSFRDGGATSELLPGFRERLEGIWGVFRTNGDLSNAEASLLLAGMVWLVGYSSAWVLYRAGWLGASLSMPAAVVIAGQVVDMDSHGWLSISFLALALILAARYTAFRRFSLWRRRGYDVPPAPAARFVTTGAAIALFALAVSQAASLQPLRAQVDQVADRTSTLLEKADDRIDAFSDDSEATSFAADGYASLESAFAIDGEVSLSQEPAVVLEAAQPFYLASQRLDLYDGKGWSSSASDMPPVPSDPSSDKTVLVTFEAGQKMYLSAEQTEQRVPVTAVVRPQSDLGGVILTIETHESVDRSSSVAMLWLAIDETYAIDDSAPGMAPVELQPLLDLLSVATLSDDGTAIPVIAEPEIAADVAAEQQRLRESSYQVESTLRWTSEGPVLDVNGRSPVYDDVQTVYDYSGLGQLVPYTVAGLRTNGSTDDLAQSSGELPAYVYEHSLQLPGSVTERTRTLAADVAAGQSGAFAQAAAVEQYLRTLTYELNGPSAPDGQDAIDYFLFDRQAGRCTHFASAMVVMMRSLGHPARIVAGFAPGTFTNEAGGYVSRFTDAHTWVEVYVAGYGWLPFEPTPSESPIDRSEIPAGPELQPLPPEPTPAVPEPTAEVTPESTPAPPPVTTTIDNDGSGGAPLSVIALALAGGASALAAVMALALWRRDLRGLTPEASAFAKARRVGRFWHVPEVASNTPTEYATEFSSVVPAAQPAIFSIAEAFNRRQYGPGGSSDVSTLDQNWLSIRRTLRQWRPWRTGR